MKTKLHLVFTIFVIFMFGISQAQEESEGFPVLKGSYLGQKSPGMTPEKFAPGTYADPENIGSIINSELSEQSVYIAPDESYIIFRRHIRGENDILMNFYISFKKNHSWTEPVCFSDKLDAKGDGFWIGLSPDQKYIFFIKKGIVNEYTRMGSDLSWVDAKIIEYLKPKELK